MSNLYELLPATPWLDQPSERELAQPGAGAPPKHARRARKHTAKTARSKARTPITQDTQSITGGIEGSAGEQRQVSAEPSTDANAPVAPSRAVILWEAPATESPSDLEPIARELDLDLGPTLGDLIDQYQTDPLSGFSKLRYKNRMNITGLLRRMKVAYGRVFLASITGRMLVEWHAAWSANLTMLAKGHTFVTELRLLFGYGFSLLNDKECERLSRAMGELRFPNSGRSDKLILPEQVEAVRKWAHIIGWHSIALASALQFELMVRQKDVIGEWVPVSEGFESTEVWNDQTWIRGFRWSEIDSDLILRHTTSKKLKPIIVDLKQCPMVMEELEFFDEIPTSDEPIIIAETSGMPYSDGEFRRKFRICANYAGIPKEICSCHNRAGGISEAFAAGVNGERIQKAATHSNIGTTQIYNRSDQLAASTTVQKGRVEKRHSAVQPDETREARWHIDLSKVVMHRSAKARRRAQ